MPRIPTVDHREELAHEHWGIYDAITASRGHATGPWGLLLHSPEIAARTAELGAYLRFESTLDDPTRETIILATARATGCKYEWVDHAPIARKAGVTEEVVAAIRDSRPEALPPDVAEIVGYAQQLVDHHTVSEEAVRSLENRLGVQGVVELTATVAYYTYLATILNAFAVEPKDGAEVLPDR
jgi:4-carboxymuconolactone decarboxylase